MFIRRYGRVAVEAVGFGNDMPAQLNASVRVADNYEVGIESAHIGGLRLAASVDLKTTGDHHGLYIEVHMLGVYLEFHVRDLRHEDDYEEEL